MIPLLAMFLLIAPLGGPIASFSSPSPHADQAAACMQRTQRSGHGAKPTPSPSVRVTIVNATAAPALSLSVTGTNGAPAYPLFRQGDWTADPPFTNTVVDYAARETNGALLAMQRITYRPVSKQYLLLTDDLSLREADASHPAPGPFTQTPGETPSGHLPTPNPVSRLQFHVIPCEGVVKDPSHYRFVNCIPGSTLILRKPAEGGRPARELALLTPGNSVLLTGQQDSVVYEAETLGIVLRIEIIQEGAVADCLIPFYLRDGKPTYATVFESP